MTRESLSEEVISVLREAVGGRSATGRRNGRDKGPGAGSPGPSGLEQMVFEGQ